MTWLNVHEHVMRILVSSMHKDETWTVFSAKRVGAETGHEQTKCQAAQPQLENLSQVLCACLMTVVSACIIPGPHHRYEWEDECIKTYINRLRQIQ